MAVQCDVMCHRRPSERSARETEREETPTREERPREAPVAADGGGGLVARARGALSRLTARLA